MKVKVNDHLKVELNTLIRLELKGYVPQLIIHERFEKYVKWIIRIITLVGIVTSVVTISKWYFALSLSILIFLIGQFFERTAFEYTTMVVLPFPDFEIDYSQWKTNGFMLPHVVSNENRCYMGPSFQDKSYAINFFKYLMQWNWNNNVDDGNRIIVSIVIEPNSKYTTYIYSNSGRKSLDIAFEEAAIENKLSKYGKSQQKLFTQMIFCKTLEYRENYYIHEFLAKQGPTGQFYFTPSVVPQEVNTAPEFLFDYSIVKFQYKLRNRNEIKEHEAENILKP
jgi:hypothetical protein